MAYGGDFSDPEDMARRDTGAIQALGRPLVGTGKPFVSTSGTLVMKAGRVGLETDAPDASSMAEFRIRGENACLQFASEGVRASVVRLAPTVHGPGDYGFIPMLIARARKTGVSAYVGDGENRWPAVHRLDAATLFRLALEKAKAGTAWHGAGEGGVRFKSIAEKIGEKLSLPTRSLAGRGAGALREPVLRDRLRHRFARLERAHARRARVEPHARDAARGSGARRLLHGSLVVSAAPETMRAVRFHGHGAPADVLVMESVPIPSPAAGRVRVVVHACGLNPADWALCRGLFAGMFPRGIGLDVAGIVDAVGSGVDDVAVGDAVFGPADYAGVTSAGAADRAILTHWARVPTGLTLLHAAALTMAVETAYRSLENLRVGPEHTLLVHGAGAMVGFAAVQMALLRGARVVATAGDTYADRLLNAGRQGDGVRAGHGGADPRSRRRPCGPRARHGAGQRRAT